MGADSCTDCVVNHPGNARGYWHADWPYNSTNASHIPAPYPDAVLHLSTIWMLTPFAAETGGTFVVPGSHRWPRNPAAGDMPAMNQDAPYPTECQIEGAAGSVLVYDSRLWHAVAPNRSASDRVALIVRYAPWWLNLNPTLIGRPEHEAMVVETGGKNTRWRRLSGKSLLSCLQLLSLYTAIGLRNLPGLMKCAGTDAQDAKEALGVAMVEVANGLHGSGVLAVERVRGVAGRAKGDLAFVERDRDGASRQLIKMLDDLPARLGRCVKPISLGRFARQ